jgi:hypothetical protein
MASGELSIDSVSGNINVVGAPREATIDSVSGDLKLILNSSNVSTESVSGDVDLRGRLDGEVHVESVSGDIDVAGHQSSVNKLTGTTVSGGHSHRHWRWRAEAASTWTAGAATSPCACHRTCQRRCAARASAGDLHAPNVQIERPKHGPGSELRTPLRQRRWRSRPEIVLR